MEGNDTNQVKYTSVDTERKALIQNGQIPNAAQHHKLTPNEKDGGEKNKSSEEVVKKPTDPTKIVGYFALFRYTKGIEVFYLIIAFSLALVHGAMMPLFSQIFGQITKDFTPGQPPEKIRSAASKTALFMFLVGVATLISAGLSSFFWGYVGERLNIRVRKMYFNAITGHEIGWFDVEDAERMTTRYIEDMHKFEGATGKKNHVLIYSLAMTFAGFLVGYINGWWYSLIVTMSFPIQAIGMIAFVVVMQKESSITKTNYQDAGAKSEQCLSSIKTVKALAGEEHEINSYSKSLEQAKSASVKFGILAGICFGIFFMTIFISYGLNYWLGSVLVDRKVYNHNHSRDYDVGDIITIFFAIITGGFALGNTSPAVKALALGREAAYSIYEIIQRKSLIPLEDPSGIIPSQIEGEIEFRNVHFNYPSRQDTKVLNGLNLKIPKGKKVAFVGETGCGKSTAMQLVERYYDPISGDILIDGKNLKEYNLMALRKFIGYVGQEPVLFALSIKENMLLAKPDAKDSEIEEALKMANAHTFVMNLEKKLDTYVGSGGSQLSGGQKQRICIARSILQNPKILLMDEATSALDRKNEREIQETLDNLSKSKERTTITIAHRLSTVINSDIIYVFDKGQAVEFGTHNDLVKKNGAYANLIRIQLEGAAPEELQLINKKSSERIDDVSLNKKASVMAQQERNPEAADEILIKNDEMTQEKRAELKRLEEEKIKQSSKKLNEYLKGSYSILTIGLIFSAGAGALMPVFAIFLADMINVLARFQMFSTLNYSRDHPDWIEARKDARMIGIYFLIMAVVAFFTQAVTLGLFNLLAQRISTRLRRDLYKHFLTRDMEFFDDPKNNPGELSSVLAKECLTVNTIVSTSYSAMVNGASSFIVGIVIAMIASWQLALVSLSVSPIIVLTGVIESKMMADKGAKETGDTKESRTFQEVCVNMRTVGSLNAQNLLRKLFNETVDKECAQSIGRHIFSGLVYGTGQFGMFAVYALTFYAGAEFTIRIGLTFQNLFRALFAIIFAAFGAGMSQQFAGNIGEAKLAAVRIFDYLDIKNTVQEDPNPVKTPLEGKIEFRNVSFTYPQRNTPCFQDLSFTIDPKKKVAFAGPSGSGKSTIFSLLYRFYDPNNGEILLDGVDIKKYDIKTLRQNLGIVSQEPTLFNSTIRYNIKYNDPNISDEQMKQAIATANATKFIEADEVHGELGSEKDESANEGKGYDRMVGLKGNKLSGGQKQRVAIARTVVRNPKIYMFDESTSALDADSERIVQDALNKISKDTTSLSIAHRISTIKDSDVIYVIEGGKLVEQGSYNELLSKKGAFYNLNKDK